MAKLHLFEISTKQTEIFSSNNVLEYGLPEEGNPAPTNWLDAMNPLKKLLLSKRSRRKVIFIDELPWLAGPQSSELVSELGFFWNQWARKRKDIFLIVCGSATSWMIDNVIREYGGLYGRTTEIIALKPFTLAECERYWEKRASISPDMRQHSHIW